MIEIWGIQLLDAIGRPLLFSFPFGRQERGEGCTLFFIEERRRRTKKGVRDFSCEERCGGMDDFISHGLSSWLSPIPNRTQDLFNF